MPPLHPDPEGYLMKVEFIREPPVVPPFKEVVITLSPYDYTRLRMAVESGCSLSLSYREILDKLPAVPR